MGLFTDISAALSFNFGDDSKLPKEFYDHIYQLDRTDEEKRLLAFLDDKFGLLSTYMESVINTINKYTDDYTNIPYDKIFLETGYSKEDLEKAAKAIKEYQKYCTEQNYHVNESYEDVTRSNKPVRESEAIQNIGNLLELLEKKIKGELDEQEKHILEENSEKWKEDIAILRNYIEQELGRE